MKIKKVIRKTRNYLHLMWFYKSFTVPFLPRNQRQKFYLFKRDGKKCQKCGTTKNLTVDHIVAKKNKGVNALSNKQILCYECNHKKDNKPFKKYRGLKGHTFD